jgi:hypothetical protein
VGLGGRMITRHAIAAAGSLVILVLVWILLNPALSLLVTGEYAETGFEPLNLVCCCSIVWLPAIIAPISFFGEKILVERWGWGWLTHILAMAAVFFVVSTILWEVLPLALVGEWPNQAAVIFVILDNTIWGVSYWLILRASDHMMRKATYSWFLSGAGDKPKVNYARTKPCVHCGEQMTLNSPVCDYCGREQAELQVQSRLARKICPYCGSKHDPSLSHCTQCGAALGSPSTLVSAKK